jgi:hypothetical protein
LRIECPEIANHKFKGLIEKREFPLKIYLLGLSLLDEIAKRSMFLFN